MIMSPPTQKPYPYTQPPFAYSPWPWQAAAYPQHLYNRNVPPKTDLFTRHRVPPTRSHPFPSNNLYEKLMQSPPMDLKPAKPVEKIVFQPKKHKPQWVNHLKNLFHNKQAIVYAMNLRTFGAEDKNQDGRISVHAGENGTFLSAIKRLDELVELGVNTIHLLPINPPAKTMRLGKAGSVYAPATYHEVAKELDVPGNNTSEIEEARKFVEECHKRGIHVMVDIPSCASYDIMKDHPNIILTDQDPNSPTYGQARTPKDWIDIVMFKNNQELVEYYEKFFDLMVNDVGVDGFRADVARARPLWFWDYFINKYRDKAWLAESYVTEDASPMANVPRDIPEHLLRVGFDSVYGQFHIFPEWHNAKEYIEYLQNSHGVITRAGINKSFIGSFLTHDDPSLMGKGGVLTCLLAAGLMCTQPWTNPYILDGFTTGYEGHYDIFNFTERPKGNHPEIGRFLKKMLALRKQYIDVITKGLFIPIPTFGCKDNQVIAFARHHQGKTLLVVANKDVNARHKAQLFVPGLSANQNLANLAPNYGKESKLVVENNHLNTNMAPGDFLVFEIDTPTLQSNSAIIPIYR